MMGAIAVPATASAVHATVVTPAPAATHSPALSPGLRGRIPDIDPNHLMVRFRSRPADLATRMARAGARIDRGIPHTPWAELSIKPGTSAQVRARLRSDSTVAQTQISYRRRALSIPNDPLWSSAQSSYLSMIRVDRAWDLTQGSGIVVAVVDTGVDLNHPDLAGRLVHGTDIVNHDGTPQDDVGHGTMVAGIIAADRNNHRGIAGIAPLAKVMPVKVLGKNGVGDDGDIATGITWATDHGANVINLSLGGPLDDDALRAAVAYAISHNVVVVAAAGNDGAETVEYPAAYPDVIAVSATGHTGALTSFSSWGSRIDIAAPGLDITSTALGTSEKYDVESGTSFSSPIVAGVAALVRARYPAYTNAQVRARLLATARDVGLPGVDRAFGHGLVDALAAVDSSHPAAPHPTFRVGSSEPNDTISEATQIDVGIPVGSHIAPETDEDWYKISFPSSGWYKILVPSGNGSFASSMDPIVELYDSTGAFQASQDLIGGPLVVFIDSASDRYIRVRNRGGDAASYTLTVTHTSAPPEFGDPLELDLGSEAQSIGYGDFNGDGRPDLAFLMGDSSAIPDVLVTLLQTPLRSFVVGDVIPTDPTSGAGLAVGDVNNDSLDDVAIPTTGGVDVFLQSGGALDPTPMFIATAFTPNHVAIAKVNADGNNDVVVGGSLGIIAYFGPGFGTSTTVTATAIPHSFAVGDVTNDGKTDVVAVIGSAVHTFTQAAGPTWVDSWQAESSPRSVALGDLDSDNHADAAVSVRSSTGEVGVMLQSGGALGVPSPNTTEEYADSVAIADVDKDGTNDVVVVHDLTGDVGILFGSGGGALGAEHTFTFDDFKNTYDANALAVGDLDSDGYPDIAVATSFGVSLLMQQPATLPTLGKTWVDTAAPADLAENVASGVAPVLTLDRAATNVDGTTVKLYDESGNEVAATPVWAGGPKTITITPNAALANGSYEVRVEGLQDGSGDTLDQFSTRFTVGPPPDESAPNTALHSPPSGFTTTSHATLSFSASHATGFECSLDNVRYKACTSPVHLTVAKGAHTFRVFAHDAAHNEDPSPAVARWTYRPLPHGYWMLGRTGHVYNFGSVLGYGGPSTASATDIEPTPSGFGYWTVDANGHVGAYGDAGFHGDASGKLVGEFVTGISRTATGRGYWLFTTRGRVFPFGDAHFYGDLRAKHLNGPILDSVATPTGHGYYMVGSDGGVFTFGDAVYKGSTGGLHIPEPIRTLVPDPGHVGYWLVGVDGSVYPFAAPFRGSMRGRQLNKPIVGMVSFGDGYLMVAADGGIFNFSNKPYFGSLGGDPPAVPIVSVAAFA
jgi:type VII secretion-associated serine protease mycosin